jgi:hypothetical protein
VDENDPDVMAARERAKEKLKIQEEEKARKAILREEEFNREVKYIQMFIDKKCAIDPNAHDSLTKLYKSYYAYYLRIPHPTSRRPEGRVMFSRKLSRLGFPSRKENIESFYGVIVEGLRHR